MAERFLPPAPLGPDGPYLEAMLNVLDGMASTLNDIRDRLAPTAVAEPDGAVTVQEPAPPRTGGRAGQSEVAEPAPRRRNRTARNGGTS